MPRKWSKAVPEGNGCVPYHDEFRSDQPTMAELYRMIVERMKSQFDQQDEKLDGLMEKTR